MKIAILSDIHANIWALQAVLADIKRQGADLIVNAGDILSSPLAPAATADLLMSLGLPTIAGNHERQLLSCAAKAGHPTDQFAFENTTQAQRDWIKGLPGTLAVAEDVYMCHGTPASDLIYFLEEVDQHGCRMARQTQIEAYAAGLSQTLIICGHSHKPRSCAVSGGRLVVNPGSVGLQAYDDDQPWFHVIENGSPHARYAMCEKDMHGWRVDHHCIGYDHHKAAAEAAKNGRDDWARWLLTGRAAS
ncbi:metallophosphoesterase family protein [Collimonas pratensis]|uniref:Calcineurin-like phosphoesterase family protein n=1 Tax=Collimonas pratensis TaxID=279113 RepID=A0ABM5Z6C9_9BURK|nr:metallophosphoesterase family protein [Collimonas pratensis]AMP14429.1 calcineurin-like phosphoesterase family protein [Collimonas pratensis]